MLSRMKKEKSPNEEERAETDAEKVESKEPANEKKLAKENPKNKRKRSLSLQKKIKMSGNSVFRSIMHSSDDILELMKLEDNIQRNMVHRAALSLEADLIESMINSLVKAKENQITSHSGDGKDVMELVSKKDKFGYTPLLCSCLAPASSRTLKENRLKIFKVFFEQAESEMDANISAIETLWTPLFWVTYYNETKCVEYLIEKGAMHWVPDSKGYFPMDIAGKMNNKEVLSILLGEMLYLIENYETTLQKGLQKKEKTVKPKGIFIPPSSWTNSCHIQTTTAFWLCHMSDTQGLQRLFAASPNKVMLEYPLVKNRNKNCFHVVALLKNAEIFEMLVKYLESQYEKMFMTYKHADFRGQVGTEINMLPLSELEDFITRKHHKAPVFKKSFLKSLKKMKAWYSSKIQKIHKAYSEMGEDNENDNGLLVFRKVRLFDVHDRDGNTPLHLAVFHESPEITEKLVFLNSSKTKENDLGWKPLEFSRSSMMEIIEKNRNKRFVSNILSLKKTMAAHSEQRASISQKTPLEDLKLSLEEVTKDAIQIPEYVIRFKIPRKILLQGDPTSKQPSKSLRKAQMQTTIADHLLKIFVQRGFDVSLFQSLDGNAYYAMISMENKVLEEKCEEKGLEMRRADIGTYEKFRVSTETNMFEPFRSRQKQEIISNLILSAEAVIPIDLLVQNNHVDQHYFMHKPDIQERIRKVWRTDWLTLVPQPFPDAVTYLFEKGNDKSFPAVNLLQQYFGERIAIYYAWMSFNTVFFVPLSILGIIFMILTYTVDNDRAFSIIFIIYVFLISLSVTVISEVWKRRSFEINAKWGTLHLMDEDSSKLESRKTFVGMEQVVFSQRKTTKIQRKTNIIIGYVVYGAVAITLGVIYIIIFLYLENWKDQYDSYYISFGIGCINSFCISICNFIFFNFANKIVERENHKYELDYQNALIHKFFPFRWITGNFGLLYLAFISPFKNSESFSPEDLREELLFYLLSLLLVKQITNTVLMVLHFWLPCAYFEQLFLPYMIYSLRKWVYFLGTANNLKRNQKRNDNKKFEDVGYRRAVFDCKEKKLTKQSWFIDYVEMNSLRKPFSGTLYAFTESIISFGYVTMFAWAFPIGPVIYVFNNVLEIKWRLLTMLRIFKKPLPEKVPTIGQWQQIWEFVGIVSVITNCLSIYISEPEFVLFEPENSDFANLFKCVILEHIIIFLKIALQVFILDKPKWVQEEEDKITRRKDNDMKELEMLLKNTQSKSNLGKFQNLFKSTIESIGAGSPSPMASDINTPTSASQIGPEAEDEPIIEPVTKQEVIETQVVNIMKSGLSEQPAGVFKNPFWSSIAFLWLEKCLIARQNRLALLCVQDPLIICEICQNNRAKVECIVCGDHYCLNCFKQAHAARGIRGHKPIILSMGVHEPADQAQVKALLANSSSVSSMQFSRNSLEPLERSRSSSLGNEFNLRILAIIKKKLGIKTNEDLSFRYNEILGEYNKTIKSAEISSLIELSFGCQSWKKLQYFSFPSPSTSDGFATLEHLFNLFVDFYSKVLSEAPEPFNDEIGKVFSSSSIEGALGEILRAKEFNNQEILLANRAFYISRPSIHLEGYETKEERERDLKNFSLNIGRLQAPTFEQRLRCFLSLMDDRSVFFVTKETLLSVLASSFVHELFGEARIDLLLEKVFEKNQTAANKSEIFKRILENEEVKQFFEAFLQMD